MMITCADCGSLQKIPPLPKLASAECRRCGRILDRRTGVGLDFPLACAVAVFVLLPPAVFLPLMRSTIQNLFFDDSRLVSSVGTIYREVWFPFAFGFMFFAFVFPLLRALLMILVLGSLRTRLRVPQPGRLFRFAEELRIWSMTDVVVIAGIVAYFRASVPADVEVQIGAWLYVAVAVLSALMTRTMDRRAVWNAILPDRETLPHGPVQACSVCEMTVHERRSGEPCPRCGGTLDRNVVKRFAPAIGALAAAIPLCLPAYSFSIMVNDQLTAVLEHTILGTVQLMADHGYWQFGVVVLVAGVVIPFVELVGMTWLLLRVRFPNKGGLVWRTRFYRVLLRLVRWPMILPFIAAMAAPIVDFRGIDDIVAGPGATPLFAVIALLTLSIHLFEPRLMWKTAGQTIS